MKAVISWLKQLVSPKDYNPKAYNKFIERFNRNLKAKEGIKATDRMLILLYKLKVYKQPPFGSMFGIWDDEQDWVYWSLIERINERKILSQKIRKSTSQTEGN
jgi:HSP90 family molecular chaperone